MSATDSVVRPDALDYLSALSLDPADLPPPTTWVFIPETARRLELVTGVGLSRSRNGERGTTDASPMPALLAGLAGEHIPLSFVVEGRPDGVRFMVGTWAEQPVYTAAQHDVVTSLLDGLYPSVDRMTAPAPDLTRLTIGGIVHGVPGARPSDDGAPWDRLLRGLQGLNFAVVTLAEPIEAATLAQLRDIALDDARAAISSEEHVGTLTPLAKAYREQIDGLVTSLNRGLSIGAWRTAVYLLGDDASYWRLAASWRATFSNAERPLSPLRIAPSRAASRLADGWVMPYRPAPRGPREWQHPFLNQTLLDTQQLASFVHFPMLDSPGFTVRPAPAFATSRPMPRDPNRSIVIGDVLAQQRKTGTSYRLDLDQMTRHAFVAGLTGSGKTNTLMHLLGEMSDAGVPFLVIEPAKTEYRELLGRPGIRERLRVFTLGREQVAPLRINPFEVPEGIDVATHLDLLKAVFMGSFAMWIPLPQVLEQCLVELYTERGWDFATGRLGHGRDAADLPTLGDLAEAVERTVPKLGYKAESTQEITASLTTRLNSLRRGTRGLMLDVERSIPMAELLRAPTIIELEGLGDDADKAFVMGLLLVRLYEHRRAAHAAELAAAAADRRPAPPSGVLSHVVIVEEAHRLLAQSHKTVDSWNADPQGAFADAFSQMLSEVRAYGQGIIIADQVPVRLAPDVIKNTNLKIVHRLVAGDDRKAMAEAMSMSDEQSRTLATLPRGRAAVFSEGDDTPVIIGVRKAKNLDDATAIDDLAVTAAMKAWRSDPAVAQYFDADALCSGVCTSVSECRASRALAQEPAGRLLGGRFFNTAAAHTDGLDVIWSDVVSYVASRTANNDDLDSRVHAFAVHLLHAVIARRTMQAQWPVRAVEKLAGIVRDMVAERVASDEPWLGLTDSRRAFVESALDLVRRSHDPYPLCTSVCADGTCMYRDPISDVLLHPRHAAFPAELAGKEDPGAYVLETAAYVANDITATSPSAPTGAEALNAARWRALACAAQVKFCGADHPAEAAALVAGAVSAAGWTIAVPDQPMSRVPI